MSGFTFYPYSDIDPAKYELVRVLTNTPKNPEDYHSLQNILRYRIVRLVHDIFGNVRVSPIGQSPLSIEIINGQKYVKVNGVWYLDGYRIFAENKTSTTALSDAHNFNIWLGIKFKEVRYTEDNKIALYDAVTQKYIETSSRILLDTTILILDNVATPDPPEGGQYNEYYWYLIGTAEYANATWTLIDNPDIPELSIKYSQGLQIIANAIHAEQDGTVHIAKLATALENNQAKLIIDNTQQGQINLRYININGEPLAAFDLVLNNGTWEPIIWMRSGTAGYPLLYITPYGVYHIDNTRSLEINSARIAHKVNRNNFTLDSNGLSYILDDKTAFAVQKTIPNATVYGTSLTIDTNNQSITLSTTEYEKASIITNTQIASYTFSISPSEIPTGGIVSINHLIVLRQSTTGTAKIDLDIYQIVNNNSVYITTYSFYISANGTINQPIEVKLFNIEEELPLDTKTFKLVYSLSTTSGTANAYVAFKTANAQLNTNNCTWLKYSTSYPYVIADSLMLRNMLLVTDASGNLRLKRITNPSTLGTTVQNITNNTIPPGNHPDDDGGLALNAQPIAVVTSTADPNLTYDKSTHTLHIPYLSQTLANNYSNAKGLLTATDYKAIFDQLAQANIPIPYSSNNSNALQFYYVSPRWSNTNVGTITIYHTTIQNAINAIVNNVNIDGGVIYVFPGIYQEQLIINSDKKIAIIGVSKETVILETPANNTAPILSIAHNNAYVHISNITFNKNTASNISAINADGVQAQILFNNCIFKGVLGMQHYIYTRYADININNSIAKFSDVRNSLSDYKAFIYSDYENNNTVKVAKISIDNCHFDLGENTLIYSELYNGTYQMAFTYYGECTIQNSTIVSGTTDSSLKYYTNTNGEGIPQYALIRIGAYGVFLHNSQFYIYPVNLLFIFKDAPQALNEVYMPNIIKITTSLLYIYDFGDQGIPRNLAHIIINNDDTSIRAASILAHHSEFKYFTNRSFTSGSPKPGLYTYTVSSLYPQIVPQFGQNNILDNMALCAHNISNKTTLPSDSSLNMYNIEYNI